MRGCAVTLQRAFVAEQSSSLTLRTGTLADVDDLEAIELRSFIHDRLSRRSFARYLNSPTAVFIVAESGGVLCGYALVLFYSRRECARLYSIAVDGKYAGQRIGSRLLSAAEDAAHHRGANAMRLEVREANVPAANLYGKSGYSLIGRLFDYYEDKSTALRLQKRLSTPSSSTA